MTRFILLALLFAACASEPAPIPPAPLVPEETAAPLAPEADSTWTSAPTDLPGTVESSTVTELRIATHDGYDRIVFELDGGEPRVTVRPTASPVRHCARGDGIAVAGAAALEISLIGARGYSDEGEETMRHARESHGFAALTEIALTCDFEGIVTWALGVASPEAAYRVRRLRAPNRIVLDIRHPD